MRKLIKRFLAFELGITFCRFCWDFTPKAQAQRWKNACASCVRDHQAWMRDLRVQWVDIS